MKSESVSKKVLLIEDETAQAGLQRKVLEAAGYRVELAGTCAQGLRSAADQPPDLILLDYQLPDGDGISLLKQLREGGYHGAVVFATAFGDEDVAARAIKGGAEEYLIKTSANILRLGEVASQAIASHASRQEPFLHAERMATLEILLSGLVHEMASPLTAILGFAELHKAAAASGAEEPQDWAEIAEAAGRCKRVIAGIQALARKRKGEARPTDVNALTRECADMRRADWNTRGLRVEEAYEARRPLAVPPQDFQMIVLRMMLSAEGLLAPGTEGFLRVSVADGPQAHVVSVEVRPASIEGTAAESGVGLTVAASVAARCGGRLKQEPAAAGGVLYSVRFEGRAVQEPEAPELPAGSAAAGRRILVIDDEQGMRDFLSYFLASNGYAVDVAEDAAQGVELYRRGRYDLVLTDHALSKSRGWQVVEAIRAADPQARLVLMTGDPENEGVSAALALGALGFIRKPFDLGELVAVLEKHGGLAQPS